MPMMLPLLAQGALDNELFDYDWRFLRGDSPPSEVHGQAATYECSSGAWERGNRFPVELAGLGLVCFRSPFLCIFPVEAVENFRSLIEVHLLVYMAGMQLIRDGISSHAMHACATQ
jgi:hypothetical protein